MCVCVGLQYGEHLTQLESNIKIAQKKAMEQADNDFLDVGEEGYDDEFLMDAIPLEVDRPGEDEWDPEEGRNKKSGRSGASSKASTGKSKSKRPKSNKSSEFKSYAANSIQKFKFKKFNCVLFCRPSGGRGASPRSSFSSPRAKRVKSDVLEDLQYSASEKEDDELEEVTMSSSTAIDVDANYDPEAEFFGAAKDEDIHDDLQVSESEEEGEIREEDADGDSSRQRLNSTRDEDDDGRLWF